MQTVSPVQTADGFEATCLPATFPLTLQSGDTAAGEVSRIKHWCLARADEWHKDGEMELATEFLRHAADLDPHDAQIWIALGSLQFKSGKFEAAGRAFIRAGHLDSTNTSIYLHLALVHQRLGQSQQAEALYRHALELQPDNTQTLNLLAGFLMAEGRHAEARELYSQLLVQRPDDIELLLKVGVCCFRSDDASAAKRCYERIHKLNPSHSLALENLEVINSGAVPANEGH